MISMNIKKELRSSGDIMSLEVDINIEDGEFVSLFGDSGSGKTTILRLLSGLTCPDEGVITVNGREWFDSEKGIDLSAQKRKVGFVFQEYNLFPNMNIRENIEYAGDKDNDKEFIKELMGMSGLMPLAERMPVGLSGGERQRVALIRAIARRPDILMLDEALSALDERMRTRLQDMIIDIHRVYPVTTIMVSHDVSEVMRLSDRVFVIENGVIEKSGQPDYVFADRVISGKFKTVGSVIDITAQGVVNIVKVWTGNNIVKIVATDEEIKGILPGTKVVLASKAFNPVIIPIE